MPRTPINYDNVYFYKLVCKDLNITECYVGHTTNFRNRKHAHKAACSNQSNEHHSYRVYQYIRDNGGWENWDMILIEECKREGRLNALKKEREFLEQLKASLNACIPTRSREEYRQATREAANERTKKHYEI